MRREETKGTKEKEGKRKRGKEEKKRERGKNLPQSWEQEGVASPPTTPGLPWVKRKLKPPSYDEVVLSLLLLGLLLGLLRRRSTYHT